MTKADYYSFWGVIIIFADAMTRKLQEEESIEENLWKS